jgi:hypothetical protein
MMKSATHQVGTPERVRKGWKIPSAAGLGVYFVHQTPHWRCTCPAWIVGHGTPCKHQLAVKNLLAKAQEVTMRD